tara:strand:- start:312 stop:833 length:522 start_codon:yes stop_codon:yes gene_type:complete
MKKGIFILLIAITFIACKSDKNNENADVNETVSDSTKPEAVSFEQSLLDYRDVNERFLDNYKVEKFGIQKTNDSLIGFVFKLNDSTTNETVEAYSLGIRGFDRNLKKPLLMTFEPVLSEIDGSKYIIATKVVDEVKYFDSISAYIYKRKDWKGSGNLGGFKVLDILLDDKSNK